MRKDSLQRLQSQSLNQFEVTAVICKEREIVPESGRTNYQIEIGDELPRSPEPATLFAEDLAGFQIDP